MFSLPVMPRLFSRKSVRSQLAESEGSGRYRFINKETTVSQTYMMTTPRSAESKASLVRPVSDKASSNWQNSLEVESAEQVSTGR